MTRPVTEFDLRAEEFKHPDIKPEDYEFRRDGKIVRKDRWERGMFRIAAIVGMDKREGFEIDDVVNAVEGLDAQVVLTTCQASTVGVCLHRKCPADGDTACHLPAALK